MLLNNLGGLNLKDFDKNREGTGTKEWSEKSYNIQTGCKHNCLYCYARANALRFKQIAFPEEWTREVIREKAVMKNWNKCEGIIMFPTTHDITPDNIKPVIETLTRMLTAGNHVLIVSKPHISCIEKICKSLSDLKNQIMFRFTIGSYDRNITAFWEPNAPEPRERILALKYAYYQGFKTSVSMEPMLGGYSQAIKTFAYVEPYVTDTIWIGKMNKIRSRIDLSIPYNLKRVLDIEYLQRDSEILRLVNELKDNPKVRWKDSIKEVIEKYKNSIYSETMEHELKTWPEYFEEVLNGNKLFEIRKNDRNFKCGDILILREYDPFVKSYTGREIRVKVTYILDKKPFVPDGYICMSITPTL